MRACRSVLAAVAAFVGLLVAAVAGAEEPSRFAQAELPPPEPQGEASEPTPEAEPPGEGPPTGPGRDVIVVRAGESQAVADVAAADSVVGFDASDLEALGAQTVEDIGKFTPGLEIVTTGSTTPTFFIRGVGLNDFNPNSASAVAIYQDDVPVNSPALQLGTLFDMEAVNVLRGPQGTGPARNASAGAIKLYSRRPSGRYASYLKANYGNFNNRDFEGGVEAPIFGDFLSGRLAFRWTERDGYATNNCGNAPPLSERPRVSGARSTSPPFSICGERVERNTVSDIRPGLPDRVNDRSNWAARGTLLFQPTLDQEWLLNAHGARRDELSRLGQAYGVTGQQVFPDGSTRGFVLGGPADQSYVPREVEDARPPPASFGTNFPGTCDFNQDIFAQRAANPNRCRSMFANLTVKNLRKGLGPAAAINAARIQLAELLVDLDREPHRGDYNQVGPTTNDTWGAFVKGDIALPNDVEFRTVTGFDTYERLVDIDLDFTPNTLFHIRTEDEGWQFTQDFRLKGQVADTIPLRWEVGGFYLMEQLDVFVRNDLGQLAFASVSERDYTQNLWSAAGYGSFEWDFWGDFTLDGGVRYNWERKKIDYRLVRASQDFTTVEDNVWSAPTGTLRLTYRFREDTHAYWKYTRGWKGGHYNATASDVRTLETAEPETIDAFETGLRGAWFAGRLGLDLSLFYYNYRQYQIFTAEQDASGPQFVVLNANDAEVYGAEVDIMGRPLPGTFLNARFSFLETQFLDFSQSLFTVAPAPKGISTREVLRRERQNSGNPLLNSPRFKLTLTAEQMVPLGRYGSLTARWDGAWTDVTYYDPSEGRGLPNQQNELFLPEETIAQSAFWLHNLRLAYRVPRGNVELAFWVRNLEDQVYKTFAFDGSTFNRVTIYFLGEPRTYGTTLSVNF